MKIKLILVALTIAAFSISSSAGVLKFSAKHVVTPAAKGSFKVAKAGAHFSAKAAKVGKKVIW